MFNLRSHLQARCPLPRCRMGVIACWLAWHGRVFASNPSPQSAVFTSDCHPSCKPQNPSTDVQHVLQCRLQPSIASAIAPSTPPQRRQVECCSICVPKKFSQPWCICLASACTHIALHRIWGALVQQLQQASLRFVEGCLIVV